MDPIAFDVRNADNKASAYITTDPGKNVLTLTVSNRTGSDLKLTPGAPVAEPPPSGGPTSLYVSFGDLVPADAIAQIKITADGWQAKYFAVPAPAIALSPTQATTLPSTRSVSFTITNFPVAGPPRPSSLTVDYYGMGDVAPSSGEATVLVENPPSVGKALSLNRAFINAPVVFITTDEQSPIKNTLVFYLSNPSPTDPLVAADTEWGPDPPEFLLSFVPGKSPGYGALSTIGRMKEIEVGLAQVYQDQWSAKPDDSGAIPLWRLMPSTHEVLGTGQAATVEFRISGLVTELAPGLTQMYLQYSGIPGYDDGYLTFQIEKQMPKPGILQFLSLTPGTIKRGDPVTLAWQTFDAASLKLTYIADGLPKELDAPDDIPFSGSYKIDPPPKRDTTYTLEIFDFSGNKVQQQVIISVVEPPPRITNFAATPARANLMDRGAITLNWTLENAENARQLTLTSRDDQDQDTDQVIDLKLSSLPARVYRSGGVPFTLRADSAINPNDHDEKQIVVETWEDSFTMTEVPTGTIISFAGSQQRLTTLLSQGWLKCDGSSVSRLDYPELHVAIGTIYGGNANPNFALPDLRGMFLRGVDDGTNRDAGRVARCLQATNRVVGDVPGSWQADQGISTIFNCNDFDSETQSKNVSVYYLIASGVKGGPAPHPPAPYVASPMIAATLLADGTILGVGPDNQLYKRPDLTGPWTPIPNSGSAIGVSQLKDGQILGVGPDNQLYLRPGVTGAWTNIPKSGAVMSISVLLDGRILGVGTDHNLYTRDSPVSPTWNGIANSGSVTGALQQTDGKIIGIGNDGSLFVRNTLTSGWVHLPPDINNGNMIGIAQLAYGVILGIGTDHKLYTRSSLASPWVPVA
jgi:Phage Tail Collar Domain/Tectonin domain